MILKFYKLNKNMDYNDKFKELRKTIPIQSNNTTQKEPDIITQLSNYNHNDIDIQIKKFEKILDNQKNLFKILSSKNSNENKKKIELFIEDNEELIEEQSTLLNNLLLDLKTIYNNNNKLVKESHEYSELVKSKKYSSIADKIRNINKSCEDINYFLQNSGILNF